MNGFWFVGFLVFFVGFVICLHYVFYRETEKIRKIVRDGVASETPIKEYDISSWVKCAYCGSPLSARLEMGEVKICSQCKEVNIG